MRRAMHWTLSIPGAVTGIPVISLNLFDKTLDGVRKLQPVTPAETRDFENLAADCTPLFRGNVRDIGLITPHDRRLG